MKDWEFLIQREDDRTWLPLETAAVELLEGRYRMIYRCDRYPNTSVDVRIIHNATSEIPPKRRVQKRTSRTNQEGLMVVVPFTRFKPGVWEFHCSSDLMTDFFGESWHHHVRIEILPHTVDVESRWDFPEDAGAEHHDYSAELGTTDADESADPTTQLHRVVLPQLGDAAPDFNLDFNIAAQARDAATAASVLLPLQINLEREPYLICRGQGLVLAGQVDVAPEANGTTPLPPVVGQLQVCLRNPENSEVVLDRWYRLPEQSPPLPFHCDLTVPVDCSSRLLLSELSVYGSFSPNAPAEILANHGFAVVVDVDGLLAEVTPHLHATTDSAADDNREVVAELPDWSGGSDAGQTGQTEHGNPQPQPATQEVIRRGVRVDMSLLQLVDTPKTERVAFRMSGRAGLPPKLTGTKSSPSSPASSPSADQTGDAVSASNSPVRKSPQLPSFGRRGTDVAQVAKPVSTGATATMERPTDAPVAPLEQVDAADLFVPEVAIADLTDLTDLTDLSDLCQSSPAGTAIATEPTDLAAASAPPAVDTPTPAVTAATPQRPPQQLELPIVASDEDLLISPEDLAMLLGKSLDQMETAVPLTEPVAEGITPFVLEDGSPGFSLDAPPPPVIQAFRALNLQQRFLTQLRSLAQDDALLDTLRSQFGGYPPTPDDQLADEPMLVDPDGQGDLSTTADDQRLLITPFIPDADPETAADEQEIVVDDEVELPAVVSPTPQPNLAEMMDQLLDEELLPTPELTLIGGNLVAGRSITVLLRLPQQPNRVGIKLWMQDRQSRAILDGPRLLADFLPDEAGYWETQVQLDVPMGCLEVVVEAIALELHSGRESHKVSINRLVLPPDLPNFALDEFELDAL